MRRDEERLQKQLVAELRLRLPKPWLVFHPANGGGRSKAEAGILKAMGVLAGVPDLFVIGPPCVNSHASVFALELKAPPRTLKSGKQSKAKPSVSPAQQAVIAQLGECGVPTLIVRDVGEAMKALANLGVPLKGRTP